MFYLLFIFLSIIAVIFIITAIIRKQLKAKSDELSTLINGLDSYKNASSNNLSKDNPSAQNVVGFTNILTDLRNSFEGCFISAMQRKDFENHYAPIFQKAHTLLKKLRHFNITPSKTISKFIIDFENINNLVKQHNEEVITFLLETHKSFFDHCLKYPLDKQQRRSIISEEDNCLVVSSAGSGKTSSIIGKVKYLTEIKGIDPHRILLISYTNKAAAELTERMDTSGLKGYTFHKLAIDIIGRITGVKPSICDNTDALFVGIYHDLLANASFKKSIVEYFIDYPANENDWEQRKNARREELSEQKKSTT